MGKKIPNFKEFKLPNCQNHMTKDSNAIATFLSDTFHTLPDQLNPQIIAPYLSAL
jgi:hypothetical protein